MKGGYDMLGNILGTSLLKNITPKIIILVSYKTQQGNWRGFCSPYDVSCNAFTKNAALESLKKLVSLYEEGLKQYGYPRHLTIKALSNSEDEKVFKKALEIIADIEKEKLMKSYYKYQEQGIDDKFEISNTDLNLSGFYYHQSAHAS